MIRKSEKEIKALANTLEHLKARNGNYRKAFVEPDKGSKDSDNKSILEEQCRAASEQLFRKKKDLQKVQSE